MPMNAEHHFDFLGESLGKGLGAGLGEGLGEGFSDDTWLMEPLGPAGVTGSYGRHGQHSFLVDPLGGIDDYSDTTSIRPPTIPVGPAPANPLEQLIGSPHVHRIGPAPEGMAHPRGNSPTESSGSPTPAEPTGDPRPNQSGHLFLDYQGQRYVVAAPADAGNVESVTLADDTTMNILSDTNGDGRVDYLSSVCFHGGWSAWSAVVDEGINGGVDDEGKMPPAPNQPPATPDGGHQEWKSETWKCVERGDWG